LDEETYSRIKDLCAQGDAFADKNEFKQAFERYRDALNLVPDPVEDWEATTWILAAIGDLYFSEGKYEKCLRAFRDAVRCPGGLGNPFIHLRLGECYLELGHPELAADDLLRAYMGAGLEAFEQEDPKYLQFLQGRVNLRLS
jgi:tetratricopeptide (TPR) repeat protein